MELKENLQNEQLGRTTLLRRLHFTPPLRLLRGGDFKHPQGAFLLFQKREVSSTVCTLVALSGAQLSITQLVCKVVFLSLYFSSITVACMPHLEEVTYTHNAENGLFFPLPWQHRVSVEDKLVGEAAT